MNALPIEPTERDRERFRDITKAMGFALEYNRNDRLGSYRDAITEMAWKIWWAQERERQLLQNLNQSQGVKLTEWENKYAVLANEYQSTCAAANDTLGRLEKAEAELARLAKQEPVTYVIDFNGYAINGKHTEIADALPTGMDLYAAPVPAVAAPAVQEEWRRVMAELADDLAIEIDQNYPPESRVYPSEQRRYKGEMEIVNRARALLQSASTGEPK